MVLGQCCSLCNAPGHNRSSCIRRLHAEIERIEADLVTKEAEVDRLQRRVAGLKVEETRRILLNDRKDLEAEDRRQRRESQKKNKATTAPKPSPESGHSSENDEWENIPEKSKDADAI
jgi:hypothetical protein